MLWALISIGMSLVHSPCLQYAGVRFLVIINKVVSDCHVGLCSKWSLSFAGELNSLCRLECVLKLFCFFGKKTLWTVFHTMAPVFATFGRNLYFRTVWAKILPTKPSNGLFHTGSPWGRERKRCLKHCIHCCRLTYNVSINHIFNQEIGVVALEVALHVRGVARVL